ncbi:MAG: hypothetical protein GH155_07335 [Spirochaeta sp.]|nr:hypothetical protein [Spirochaeta sp.]
MSFHNFKQKLALFFEDLQIVNRNKATEMLSFEVMELENIFSLLLFGSFTGMPSPPVHITLQLLPLMERELQLIFSRINVAHDGLAEVVSILGEP